MSDHDLLFSFAGPGAVPWTIQWEPNLLNYGIEGCHPDLLFGARAFLIFGYVLPGVVCCCVCCAMCSFVAALDAHEKKAEGLN